MNSSIFLVLEKYLVEVRVFERCVLDVPLSCACYLLHLFHYHYCHHHRHHHRHRHRHRHRYRHRVDQDLYMYFLVGVNVVAHFLFDERPFLYFVAELMLTACQG